MLRELLTYWRTPCPAEIRKMGYLREAVGISARYRRRKANWLPHLLNSTSLIMEAVELCDRKRKALILGSGALYDIPLAQLAQRFESVILVDLIHLPAARRAVSKFPNCHLLQHDVTELLTDLQQHFRRSDINADRTLAVAQPQHFLDDNQIDLVVSANILSQLHLLPLDFVRRRYRRLDKERREERNVRLDRFAAAITRAHLDYLRRFAAITTLICDVAKVVINKQGETVDVESAINNVELPFVGRRWVWDIAPRPEIHRSYSLQHWVLGVADIHSQSTAVTASPPPDTHGKDPPAH